MDWKAFCVSCGTVTEGQRRLFLALVPPRETCNGIRRAAQSWSIDGRPVAPECWHVTLVFLGAVKVDRIIELADLCARQALPECTIVLDELGAFSRARVAWLGCRSVPDRLLRFRSGLAQSLRSAGFVNETRPWKPHLTLYRELRTVPDSLRAEPVEWPIREWRLMASRLGSGVPEYRTVERWSAVRNGEGPRSA